MLTNFNQSNGTLLVDSFADLRVLKPQFEGQKIKLVGWNSGSTLGGGEFIGSLTTGTDDGGTVASKGGNYSWSRIIFNCVTPEMFGALGDGSNNDVTAFLNCATFANTNRTPIQGNGNSTYTFVDTDDARINLTFSTNVDLGGATLDLDNYYGRFFVQRLQTPVVYDTTSDIVKALVAGDTLSGNYFPALASIDTLDDTFYMIKTSQPYYYLDSVVRDRIEMNRSIRWGTQESALSYDLDPSLITEIDAYPMEKEQTFFGNFTFKRAAGPWHYGIVVQSSRVVIKDILFVQDNEILTANSHWLRIVNSCDIEVRNVGTPWTIRSESSDNSLGACYVFNYENSYNVRFYDCQALGTGWGSCGGTGLIQKLLFDNCKLTRIDSHDFFIEYIKVFNTELWDQGVYVNGIGDIILDNVTQYQIGTNYQGYAYNAFIASRPNGQGIIDGDLIVNNCRFVTESTNTVKFLRGEASNTYNTLTYPDGSPVNYTFFNNVTVTNTTINSVEPINILGEIVSTGKKMTCAKTFTFVNVITNNGFVDLESTYCARGTVGTNTNGIPLFQKPNLKITLDNVALIQNTGVSPSSSNFAVKLKDNGTSQLYVLDLTINNLYSVDGATYQPSLNIAMGGVAKISNSTIESINFSLTDSVRPKFYLDCKVDNSIISNRSLTDGNLQFYPFVYFNSFVNLSVNNSTIVAQNISGLTFLAASAKINNCDGYLVDSGKSFFPITSDIANSTGSVTITNHYRFIQKTFYLVLSIASITDTNYISIPFTLPEVNGSIYLPVTSTTGITVNRTTTTTVTFSNTSGYFVRYITAAPMALN